MNKKEQRISIAEACGWSEPNSPRTREQVATWTKPEIWMTSPNGELGFITDCPDYCNDLNAMHEAEKVLDKPQHSDYICHLYYKTMGLGGGICDWQDLASATAAQRAEAFLKTIRKWQEQTATQ